MILRVLSALILALAFTGTQACAEEFVYDRILVKVNDGIITKFDLDQEMKPVYAQLKGRVLSSAEKKQLARLRRQMLDKMVQDRLMDQEVARFGVTVDEKDIDDEIRRICKKRGMNEDEFGEVVKQDGLTLDEFRERLGEILKKQQLLSHMVSQKVVVTDTEIQEAYEADKDAYVLEKAIDLAIIMLPQDVAAKEVRKRILDGEMTFAEAAAKYSVGPASEEGGAIGEVEWSAIADDWKAALEGLEAGGVSEPLIVQGREALLELRKVAEDRMVPLEEVKDELYRKLLEQKHQEVFDGYFQDLRRRSVIVYMDDTNAGPETATE